MITKYFMGEPYVRAFTSTKESNIMKLISLVFCRKDLCGARPKMQSFSNLQMSFLHLIQMYPP